MSKLTYEDKIEIYYKKKNGQSRYSLAKEYHIRDCNISYLVRLIDKHGLDILRKNQNRKYSSYKGTVGKIADNYINCEFYADKPNQKWYTDVTV